MKGLLIGLISFSTIAFSVFETYALQIQGATPNDIPDTITVSVYNPEDKKWAAKKMSFEDKYLKGVVFAKLRGADRNSGDTILSF